MVKKLHSVLTGSELHEPKTHSSSHTDGTDDVQSATSGQKGLATASQIGKLDGIETAADVTDAVNVEAAGAVMDDEYALDQIMVGTGAGTHHQIALNASEFLARKGTGNVDNVTAAEARTILQVADGATKYPDTGEQAFLDADRTKLDGIEDAATADQDGAGIKALYEAEADTNEFSDAEETKLTGIETAADVTDAANVAAAGAVMDSDISEAEGFMRKTGSGAYEAIKSNLGAAVAPTVNEDTGDGYAVGSIWIDTTADKAYMCVDPTMAGAIWKETTVAAGAGSGDMLKSTYDPNDDGIIATAQTEATKYPDTGEQAFLDADHTKLNGIEDAADVTDATNVAAAGAIMDSDITLAEGFVRKTGAGAYEAIKTNMSAAVAPTVNEDGGDGYAIGSQWLDTTADKAYVCLDHTIGAAVWIEITQAGGGSGDMLKSVYDSNDDGIIAVAQTEATLYPDTGEQAFLDADHTKLDGIDAGADVTGNNAPQAHENTHESGGSDAIEFDSLADGTTYKKFLATERTKLTGIETNATADQTNAEIRTAVEAATDSNVFTDADHAKLNGVETGADVTDVTNVAATGAMFDVDDDTSPQLGGDLNLNGHEILLDTTPGTDHTASGTKGAFTNGNAGSVAFGDVCFMAADGHLEFADADASTTMPALYMALGTITSASSGEWLIMGVARDDTWNWTVGPGATGLIYVSLTGTTANTLTQTAPSATGDQVQIVGTAISADTMMFNPSPVLVEIA